MKFIDQGGERLKAFLQALNAEGGDLEVTLKATLRPADGQAVEMIREEDGWRVDSGPPVPPAGFSPESAVEKFLQAIEARDCQALLACASPRVLVRHSQERLAMGCRAQMETIAKAAARLRRAEGKLVRVSEDRAEMVYHQHRKLVVVKYQDRWYVEDL